MPIMYKAWEWSEGTEKKVWWWCRELQAGNREVQTGSDGL